MLYPLDRVLPTLENMNICLHYISANIRIYTEVEPDDPVPDWGLSMGGIELQEGNTFSENGVQEGSVIVVSSRTIILVLNDLANKGYDLSLALHVKFDEVHSTDILDALIQMCESTQESDMKIFFEQLKGDNEVAKRKMRDGFSRAEDGESLAEYDEWSMQMSNLETIGRNCPYWEAENLYDEENPDDFDYELQSSLVSILTTIQEYVKNKTP